MSTSRAVAVTVVGRDRPGIIAEVTGRLADLGLNLEDSSMTRLRGHFAMTLICRGEAVLDGVLDLGTDLTVTVHELGDDRPAASTGTAWVLTVHGGDRPGIVSAVLAEVARVGGNVTDLSTRLAGDLYLLLAEVDLPVNADVDALATSIGAVAQGLGVAATLRPADTDEL